MDGLPETVLQFGGGNFLRAFADLFVHDNAGQGVGRVVVVQSTQSNRAVLLNGQEGRYHVVIRGISEGHKVDRVTAVESISRAVVAQERWEDVLTVGRSEHLRFIVSNTTEAGFALVAGDRPDAGVPQSFPAKLLCVLRARFDAGMPGVTVLPCELVDDNGDRLLNLVLEQAGRWNWQGLFLDWLRSEVGWPNTLVDRIVSGKPAAHPLLAEDALLTVAEPFALWVVGPGVREGDLFDHPVLKRAEDVRPFALRKVRILNGAHTALVCKALPMGIETVREAVEHPNVGAWLRQLMLEEMVPTVEDQVEDAEGFAGKVLERFANPFLEHRLADIALHHETKVRVRLVSTMEAYREKFGREPRLLSEIARV